MTEWDLTKDPSLTPDQILRLSDEPAFAMGYAPGTDPDEETPPDSNPDRMTWTPDNIELVDEEG